MPTIAALQERLANLRQALDETRALYNLFFHLGLHEELQQIHIIQHTLSVRIEQLEAIITIRKSRGLN